MRRLSQVHLNNFIGDQFHRLLENLLIGSYPTKPILHDGIAHALEDLATASTAIIFQLLFLV
jgi:hypothetical protein